MSHRDSIRSDMDYQRPTRSAAGYGSTQPDFGVYYDPTQPADHPVTPSRLDALANLAAGTAKKRGREAGGEEEEVLYFEQKGGTQPLPLATGTLNLDWVEHRGARCANAQCCCYLIFVEGITKPIRWSSSWAAPRLPRWSASWTVARLLECAGSSAKG